VSNKTFVKFVEFAERFDTILFILGLIIVGILLFGIVNGYGATVTDDNKGNKGYILINNGKGQGHQGSWTDAKTIPELKGDTGETGANGKDVDPLTVTNLQNEDISLGNKINTNVVAIDNLSSVNKKQDKQLQDHENRINDVSNRVGKLEQTQYVLETSFRILDTKRISLRPFFRQNFTRNKVDVVGLKIDVKLGQSYEEKLINKINTRLDLLEKTIGNAPIIEKVIDKKGNLKSISITNNGLSIKGGF
jgi:hypothetical protein